MNFESKGINICKITSVKTKGNDDVNIFIADKKDYKDVKYIIPEIKLKEDSDEIMQHLPYFNKGAGNTRQILYVSGASGSGKSFYTSDYMKEYNRLFPKNKIYIFSSLEKDEKLDAVKNTKRIKLNEVF